MKYIIMIMVLMLAAGSIYSQPAQKLIREGNSKFQDGKYKEAEIDYRKALEKTPSSLKATYNLGNSQYKQQNYKESTSTFERIASDPKSKNLAQVYHNLGNSYLQNKQYKESIEAYKKALRLNPLDEDTRYNLAYAMSKLAQQKNENKQDKNNQNQQQKQQQQKQQQQQQEQQKQNQKISKKDADRMLNALNNNEKRTLEKLKKQKSASSSSQPEKDW